MSAMKTKACGYNCGTEIYWDDDVKRYKEVDNDEVHRCPNYVKGSKPSTTSSSTYTKSTPKYTPKQENGVTKNADNSFTYITGSIREIQLQYEIISALVQEAGGKIHGSQRGTDAEGQIDLLVYWEVPKGFKTNVQDLFNKQTERLGI